MSLFIGEAAKSIGVSPATLKRWFRNAKSPPTSRACAPTPISERPLRRSQEPRPQAHAETGPMPTHSSTPAIARPTSSHARLPHFSNSLPIPVTLVSEETAAASLARAIWS